MRRELIPFEGLIDFSHLRTSAQKAFKARRGRTGQLLCTSGLRFMQDLEDEVLALQRELLSGEYRPGSFRHFWICDRKPRFISAAPFRDRVVHHGLTALMSPRLERYADPHSYACRPGRGLHRAIKYAQRQCQRYPWALRLDIAHYFETIPHPSLKALLRKLFKGERALAVCDLFIDHAPLGCAQGHGLPIGNLTSQHFANLYLGQLDHALRHDFGVSAYLRYMDDLTLFGASKQSLREAHRYCEEFTRERLGLSLKESSTRLGSTARGVPLLGFRVFPTHIRFDAARLRRYRMKRRRLDRRWRFGAKTEQLRARSEALSSWAAVASTFEMRRLHSQRLS